MFCRSNRILIILLFYQKQWQKEKKWIFFNRNNYTHTLSQTKNDKNLKITNITHWRLKMFLSCCPFLWYFSVCFLYENLLLLRFISFLFFPLQTQMFFFTFYLFFCFYLVFFGIDTFYVRFCTVWCIRHTRKILFFLNKKNKKQETHEKTYSEKRKHTIKLLILR